MTSRTVLILLIVSLSGLVGQGVFARGEAHALLRTEGIAADDSAWADDPGIQANALSGPEWTFEFMWKSLDANYSLFKTKNIDWKALYNMHRPLVHAKTTDDELFSIMSKTLSYLNDNHVSLIVSMNPIKMFNAGFLYDCFGLSGLKTYFGLMQSRPVPGRYFKKQLLESENKLFAYGWLEDGIGYFHFNAFDDFEGSVKAIDEIMAEFKNARAMIVDVRRNGGGAEKIGRMLAGRFADRKRFFLTTQERNGLRHDDFDPQRHFFIKPEGPIQFTKTVILLTNRLSVSAAENFALALRILPHVTVVGDFTSGCFADNDIVNLPNGWTLSVSTNLDLDHDGMCWEGIGVPPDLKIAGDYSGAERETDPVLETACLLINSGKPGLQDENEGVRPALSLVEGLAQEMEKDGIDQAIKNYHIKKESAEKDNYYEDLHELISLGRKMLRSRQVEKGEKIFSLARRLFPGVSMVNDQLGLEYLRLHMKKEAMQEYEQAVAQKEKQVSPYSRQFGGYLTDRLIAKMLSGGRTGMAKEYEAIQQKFPLQANEELLNGTGGVFLDAELFAEAVATFKLNVEKHPRSFAAYDHLADSYMRAGNKKLAIQNYEKSLRLNPKNTNAIEQLKKLR